MQREILSVFALLVPTYGQELTIDWPTKTALGCQAVTSSGRSLTVTLRNVNDILYTYQVNFDVKATVPNDWGHLFGTTASADRAETLLVETSRALELVEKAVKENPSLTAIPGADGKYASVAISTTQAAWRVVEASADYAKLRDGIDGLANASFPNQEQIELLRNVRAGAAKLAQFGQRVKTGNHSLVFVTPITQGADNTVKIAVSEYANGQITGDGKAREFTCEIKSAALSLSAGVLVSTIGGREYNVRAVPSTGANGQTANTTYNALTVDNRTNVQPVGVALLNYQLPGGRWAERWNISAGPTFRLGGASGQSPFGFFSGVSFDLWKRLFITPGAHLGQYSDFPVGYSENSFVPAGLGNPVPVKRWTVKFGVAITFRTTSFDGLDLGIKPPAAPAAKPIEAPKAEAPKAPAPAKEPAAGGADPNTIQPSPVSNPVKP